ncbi:MAG: 16S rRNA processing protein RimM [Eggerthellaceae bacterium]|nr:16S rRNA processing protein RimM [Eggerthellaceae bacterium]
MEVAFVPPQTDCPRFGRVVSVGPAREARASTRLVSFDSVRDIAVAEALSGCSCLARRGDLPDGFEDGRKDSYCGFRLVDEVFGSLGTVDEVIDNPGQRLISVVGERGRVLIPFVDEFVRGIDEDAECISTAIPAGLLALAAEPVAPPAARASESDLYAANGGGERPNED